MLQLFATARATLTATAGSLVLAGCFPAFTHGPHVSPGIHATTTETVSLIRGDTSTSAGILPGGDLGFAAAIGPHGGGGVRFGAQASVFYAALDVFVEFPHALDTRVHAGLGVMLVALTQSGQMPYGMLGVDAGRGTAFIAQGLAFLEADQIEAPVTLGVTTLGYQTEGLMWFATGFVGYRGSCSYRGLWCARRYAPRAMLGLATSLALTGGRAADPGRPHPPRTPRPRQVPGWSRTGEPRPDAPRAAAFSGCSGPRRIPCSD